MPAMHVSAVASADGLSINGRLFNSDVPLERYQDVLGLPSRTIEGRIPAPYGHRNNQVHVFDSEGMYLIEHHASRLIVSVDFIFDLAESTFPVETVFDGSLEVDGHSIRPGMSERDIMPAHLRHVLAGYYRITLKNGSSGFSAVPSQH